MAIVLVVVVLVAIGVGAALFFKSKSRSDEPVVHAHDSRPAPAQSATTEPADASPRITTPEPQLDDLLSAASAKTAPPQDVAPPSHQPTPTPAPAPPTDAAIAHEDEGGFDRFGSPGARTKKAGDGSSMVPAGRVYDMELEPEAPGVAEAGEPATALIEPAPSTESVDGIEPAASTESVDEIEPTPVAESVDGIEPVASTESVDGIEPVASTESVEDVEPVASTESVEDVEPVAATEPVEMVEPAPEPEPVAVVEPAPEPEPVAVVEPEPVVETAAEAEPVVIEPEPEPAVLDEAQPVAAAGPPREPAAISEPEIDQQGDVAVVVEASEEQFAYGSLIGESGDAAADDVPIASQPEPEPEPDPTTVPEPVVASASGNGAASTSVVGPAPAAPRDAVDHVLQALISRAQERKVALAQVAAELVEQANLEDREIDEVLGDLIAVAPEEKENVDPNERLEELTMFNDAVPKRPGQINAFDQLGSSEKKRVIIRVLCLLVALQEDYKLQPSEPASEAETRSWPLARAVWPVKAKEEEDDAKPIQRRKGKFAKSR